MRDLIVLLTSQLVVTLSHITSNASEAFMRDPMGGQHLTNVGLIPVAKWAPWTEWKVYSSSLTYSTYT